MDFEAAEDRQQSPSSSSSSSSSSPAIVQTATTMQAAPSQQSQSSSSSTPKPPPPPTPTLLLGNIILPALPPIAAKAVNTNTAVSDSGKRKIVSCLDCHSRKVKCSKTRPVCEQCIKRGKQDTCVYELAEDDEEYDRLPATKRPQLSQPKPPKPPKIKKTAASTSSHSPQPPPHEQFDPPPPHYHQPLIPPPVREQHHLPPQPPRPVATPRRQDDLLELDEVKLKGHCHRHSALGLCKTLLSMPDFSPDPASAGASYHEPPPIVVPGLDNVVDHLPPTVPAPQDWGCSMPDREELDKLLNFFLSYLHELHPLYQTDALRNLVYQLVGNDGDGSDAAQVKQLRKQRQVGMAQVLLVLALGGRCAVRSDQWEEEAFVRAARQKLLHAPKVTSGFVRAKALLAIYYLDVQRFADSYIALGEAIAAARFLGYHLSETGQPVTWNTLVRLSLLHAFITGAPHDENNHYLTAGAGSNNTSMTGIASTSSQLLPLVQMPTSPFAEPLPPPLRSSAFTHTSHSFARYLSDANALSLPSPGNPTGASGVVRDQDQFWYLDQRVRSWAPTLTEADFAAHLQQAYPARRLSNAGSGGGSEDREPATMFARVYYLALSRLILLVVRAPFAAQRTTTLLGGAGTHTTFEARFGRVEEAVRDAREVVEATKLLRIYYDEFAAGSGMIHLANAIASMVLSIYILRNPWSPSTTGPKTDIMRTTVMMYDLIEEDAVARMGYAVILRMRERYEEKVEIWQDENRQMVDSAADVTGRGGVPDGGQYKPMLLDGADDDDGEHEKKENGVVVAATVAANGSPQQHGRATDPKTSTILSGVTSPARTEVDDGAVAGSSNDRLLVNGHGERHPSPPLAVNGLGMSMAMEGMEPILPPLPPASTFPANTTRDSMSPPLRTPSAPMLAPHPSAEPRGPTFDPPVQTTPQAASPIKPGPHEPLPPPDHWSFSSSMTFADIDHLTAHDPPRGGTSSSSSSSDLALPSSALNANGTQPVSVGHGWNDTSWVGFLESLYPLDGPLYGGEWDDYYAALEADKVATAAAVAAAAAAATEQAAEQAQATAAAAHARKPVESKPQQHLSESKAKAAAKLNGTGMVMDMANWDEAYRP